MLSRASRGPLQVITWNSNSTIPSPPNRKRYPRRIKLHSSRARKNDLTRMTRCLPALASTKCQTHARSGSQSTHRLPIGAKPRESSEITFLESITQASAHMTSHYSTRQVALHWAVVALPTTSHCATEIWTQLFEKSKRDLRLVSNQQFRSHLKLLVPVCTLKTQLQRRLKISTDLQKHLRRIATGLVSTDSEECSLRRLRKLGLALTRSAKNGPSAPTI